MPFRSKSDPTAQFSTAMHRFLLLSTAFEEKTAFARPKNLTFPYACGIGLPASAISLDTWC
jgi:hypothetical protein